MAPGLSPPQRTRRAAPRACRRSRPTTSARPWTRSSALGATGRCSARYALPPPAPSRSWGVNLGDLGFLVEVGPDELPAALDRLDAGEFTIETHHGLEVDAPRGNWVAFNDVALARVPATAPSAPP